MYKSATISPTTETTTKVTTNLDACVGFAIVTIAGIAIVTPTWYIESSKKYLRSTSIHICWLYKRFRLESHLLGANHRPYGSEVRKGFLMGKKRDWCFTCEFEALVLKSKNWKSPLSPDRIYSQIENIGSNLGHGREEDAHEFLRYAIDIMQSVCLKEAETIVSNPLEEETTLIGLTFGGYLRSKIKCMKCGGKSEKNERMMDLTVEIEGDIGTLEEALKKYTSTEMLDGENKYKCSRCKSNERAKKKLTLLEAPNVLTIALKRFQSGKFGKLNKSIHFPEILDMAPYMSGTSDMSPVYRLYGVVVHLDRMNAAFSGHYVSYVKNIENRWFKTDDDKVKEVDVKSVLTKGAYMLLYARCSPRAPRLLLRNHHDFKKPKEVATSSTSTSHASGLWSANHDHLRIRLRKVDDESSSSSDGSGPFSDPCDSSSCSTRSSQRDLTSIEDLNLSDSDTSSSSSYAWRSPDPLGDHKALRERSRSCKEVSDHGDHECRKLSCSNSCREANVDRLVFVGDLRLWWVELVVEAVVGSDDGGRFGGGDDDYFLW
uniref:Ubiquitin carboxyl-terminal hydrolase 16-like n=1 Tax=Tanacetum cinerariifolium TaxID=118510 RepID=A0A6L2P2M1_TANCI|nr:ubiquitin carboxyl-terminal hydrolase 16-like [Tanacetum cinerariifolium]